MNESGVARFTPKAARGLFGAALALLALDAGCGGIVVNGTNGSDGDSGVGGTDEPPSFGGRGGKGATAAGSSNVKPPPPLDRCGNGRIDPPEECDMSVSGRSCTSATMGAKPFGTLSCSAKCTYDVSNCRSQGGSGGAMSTGGSTGTGGMSPADACYAVGGVADPSNPVYCLQGESAINACVYYYSSNGPLPAAADSSCAVSCGCQECPSTFAECAEDGGCRWVFGCALDTGCSTLPSCYANPSCQFIIDQAGGPSSIGARLARDVLLCLNDYRCPLSCGIPIPLAR